MWMVARHEPWQCSAGVISYWLGTGGLLQNFSRHTSRFPRWEQRKASENQNTTNETTPCSTCSPCWLVSVSAPGRCSGQSPSCPSQSGARLRLLLLAPCRRRAAQGLACHFPRRQAALFIGAPLARLWQRRRAPTSPSARWPQTQRREILESAPRTYSRALPQVFFNGM